MIHPTADVSSKARIGAGVQVWHQVQIRAGVHIGDNCILGKNVYIDQQVSIGRNVKIQNNASVYHGVTLEDGVFIGPHVCLTNDKNPRAITTDGKPKSDMDWMVGTILVEYGASIGARAVVLPDVKIGRFAFVGAGAVVTRDVPAHGLVVGNPARLVGYVCKDGRKLVKHVTTSGPATFICEHCQEAYSFSEI